MPASTPRASTPGRLRLPSCGAVADDSAAVPSPVPCLVLVCLVLALRVLRRGSVLHGNPFWA